MEISTDFYPLGMHRKFSVTSLSAVTCLQTGNFAKSSIRILVSRDGKNSGPVRCSLVDLEKQNEVIAVKGLANHMTIT